MKKKIIMAIAAIAIIGIGTVLYMFNLPHRDVSASKVDYKVAATSLVKEFIDNKADANDKYLAEDGDSKILEVDGIVDDIITDKIGQKVVLLKGKGEKMGVSASFTTTSNAQLNDTKKGDHITIKGVIRSGAEYDADLDLAEDVIIEKATLL